MKRTRGLAVPGLSAIVVHTLLALVLLGGSIPASAYVDLGNDPRDADAYDISSTIRRVQRGKDARMLKLTVDTYDEALGEGSWVGIEVRLDARGGRAADAVLGIWIADQSGNSCRLEKRNGAGLEHGYLRFLESGSIVCRVPVRSLHPARAIRWKVTVTSANGEPVYDVAPNRGMYG